MKLEKKERDELKKNGWKYSKYLNLWVIVQEECPLIRYSGETVYISRFSKMGADIKDFYNNN